MDDENRLDVENVVDPVEWVRAMQAGAPWAEATGVFTAAVCPVIPAPRLSPENDG